MIVVHSRSRWGSLIGSLGLSIMVVVPSACGIILGIESGQPLTSSVDGSFTGSDGSLEGPCSQGNPDPFICNGRCGLVQDRCGNEVDCPADCTGTNWTCNTTTKVCECNVSSEQWCRGRCGKATDYCGVEHDCTCPGNDCNQQTGYCGNCQPDPGACGDRACGSISNGCAEVACGPMNGGCPTGSDCRPDGTCCKPISRAEACSNNCRAAVDNGCGVPYDCSDSCAPPFQCGPARLCCLPAQSECNPMDLVDHCCGGTSCREDTGVPSETVPPLADSGIKLDASVSKFRCQ